MKNISTTSGVNNSASSNALNVSFQIQDIAACSLVVFKAVSIVAGNSLLIILFGLKKKLRKKSLFLIVNMALADVLLGAVTLPLMIYLRISHTSNIFVFLSYYLFSLASLISAVFVSCERFYAICRPLKHRTLSFTTYRTAIVVAWVLAVLSSTALTLLAKLISLRTAQTAACSFPVISLFVVCACNINIFRKSQRRVTSYEQHNRFLQKQRLTKTLQIVSTVAVLTWIPLVVFRLVVVLKGTIQREFLFYDIVLILNVSSSALNPFIYAFRIPEFRKSLRLCCLKSRAEMKGEGREGKDIIATSVTPVQKTLSTIDCYSQGGYTLNVMDTKL